MKLIGKRESSKDAIVEYRFRIDENEENAICVWPHNVIRFKLYSYRDKIGNILYFDAEVGFAKEGGVESLDCNYKIIVGLDSRHLQEEEYIKTLISSVLREQDFRSGKIDLSKGLYTYSDGKKVPSGRYVGELEDCDGVLKKYFNEAYGLQVHDSLDPINKKYQKITNFNKEKSTIKDKYIKMFNAEDDPQKRKDIQEDYRQEVLALVKKHDMSGIGVMIEDLSFYAKGSVEQ